MSKTTRKDFLGLSAAVVTSAVLGETTSVNAMQVAPETGSAAGPTLIRGADLLTMDSTLGEMQDTDVLIEDGKISAIGRGLSREGAEIIEANGMILMPGMCDGHRHMWHNIDAGRLVKIRPSLYAGYRDWQMRTMVSMNPEDHYLSGYLGGLLAIDSGVTSVVDYAHAHINADSALAAGKGVKDSGVGGWFALQLGVSSSYAPGDVVPLSVADSQRIAPTTETHWATAERLQREVFSGSSDIMQLGLAPSSGQGSSIEEIRREWTRVRDMGVNMLAAHFHKPPTPTPRGTMGIAILV